MMMETSHVHKIVSRIYKSLLTEETDTPLLSLYRSLAAQVSDSATFRAFQCLNLNLCLVFYSKGARSQLLLG